MGAVPPDSTERETSPWVGAAFVLLPLVAVALVAALWRWRDPAPTAQATLALAPAVAASRVERTAPAISDAGPVASARVAVSAAPDADGGPPAFTVKTVKSMLAVSALLKRNADEAAALVDKYCAATAKLPENLFNEPDAPDGGALRDAAYFLEPLVSWDHDPRIEGLLQIPPATVAKLRAAHGDWANQLTAADTAGVDFSWMSQLITYDYWSLATVGPTADQQGTVDPFNMTIPFYPMLVDYAKLRYVRALAQGDLAEAIREVQHLADIVHSNDIMIGDFAAVRIVELQGPFFAAAAARGYPPQGPAPLDDQGETRYHDLLLAGTAFTMPGVDDAVMKKGLDCAPNPCIAINEAISEQREMATLSERGDSDPFWGEAESRACDVPLFNLVKAAPSGGFEALDGYLSGSPLPLEKLFGAEIAAKANAAAP